MSNILRIATLNIHKGVTHFSARLALQHQYDLLQKTHADIVFLQEVRDVHTKHKQRFPAWPALGQAEFLASAMQAEYAYGKNAVYPAGHHGNVILSKHPIMHHHNLQISAHVSEQRGMLHCEIAMPHWHSSLHAVCIHLGLFSQWRQTQLRAIADYIEQAIPAHAPLIIAGDFNEWRKHGLLHFAQHLQLHEAFEHHTGKPARSFPSWLPMLRLDRIYMRGFQVKHVEVHAGAHFLQVSDHAMLSATLIKI